MSTRCYIVWMREGKRKHLFIYVHYDGYPEGVGMHLLLRYNSEDKVESLIGLGDCSTIIPEPVPYGNEAGYFNGDLQDIIEKLFNEEPVPYAYIFYNGVWYVVDIYDKKVGLLKEVIE